MRKIKVFFIAPANNIHTIRWVNSLCEEYEVHLVSCRNHVDALDKIDNKVILHKLFFPSPIGYYLNAIQLRKLYKKIKPDLINVHYASGYGTLTRVSKVKPVLLSIWGSDVYDFPNESSIKRKIFEKNVLNANYIASTSNAMANELKRKVDIGNRQIFITPFGVNVDKFKKIELEKNNEEFIIGNIKTLEPKYGIKYAILAVKDLINRLIRNKEEELANSIKLYIYGKGKEKESLEKLIDKNKLQDSVFLMGRIPNEEVPDALNKLDVFCATSILDSESFGVAVVEAMACEVPVVATNVDGFSEVMENGVTGILVERKNISQISLALEKMLKDKKKRKEYGKNGRERVIKNYNWKDNVAYMSSIYKKIYDDTKKEEL